MILGVQRQWFLTRKSSSIFPLRQKTVLRLEMGRSRENIHSEKKFVRKTFFKKIDMNDQSLCVILHALHISS